MFELKFSPDHLKFIKDASDKLLKKSGTTYSKDVSALLDKLGNQDSQYGSKDIQLIQLLCDVGLKALGLYGLKDVVGLLNFLASSQKQAQKL